MFFAFGNYWQVNRVKHRHYGSFLYLASCSFTICWVIIFGMPGPYARQSVWWIDWKRKERERERERERQRKRKTGKTQIWFGIVEPLHSWGNNLTFGLISYILCQACADRLLCFDSLRASFFLSCSFLSFFFLFIHSYLSLRFRRNVCVAYIYISMYMIYQQNSVIDYLILQ